MNSVFVGVFVGVSISGAGAFDRPKKDGRLRVLLRRRIGNDADALFPERAGDDDESTSVCERCTRPGRARGPPGTDGALVICTGRGLGGVVRLCLLDRPSFSAAAGLLTFLVLTFRPREEKKPPALDPTESDVVCDNCAPIGVEELRELIVDWTPASAG